VSNGIHIYWLLSRAAGITAMALSGLSVTAGLLVSKSRGRGSRLEARPLHEVLSLCTLAMVALHGLVLLGDPWLRPGLTGIAIPFASGYRPVWTGLGIIGAYGLAALGLSYYARTRIGVSRWRLLHRFTAAFWVLALVHAVGAGSDASQAWFLALLAITSGPPLVLLGLRLGSRIGIGAADPAPLAGPS
jgi:sulfoxide reductase heme-binding subunit YedZ